MKYILEIFNLGFADLLQICWSTNIGGCPIAHPSLSARPLQKFEFCST